jgi:hypothetical protein
MTSALNAKRERDRNYAHVNYKTLLIINANVQYKLSGFRVLEKYCITRKCVNRRPSIHSVKNGGHINEEDMFNVNLMTVVLLG